MRVSGTIANTERSALTYYLTDKGKQWCVAVALEGSTERRHRGFWSFFRFRS
jgi:hypothetical protein